MPITSGMQVALTTKYTNYEFQVLDGDTGQPLKDVALRAKNNKPTPDTVTVGGTDERGIGKISVEAETAMVTFTADGYMPMCATRYTNPEWSRVVRMYHPPQALAGLMIPREFRGILRVKHPSLPVNLATAAWLHDQREFFTPANVDGLTAIEAPPLTCDGFGFVEMRFYVARFDDGTSLPYDNPLHSRILRQNLGGMTKFIAPVRPREDGLALFNLGSRIDLETGRRLESAYEVLWVGTREQAKAAQRQLVAGAATAVLWKANHPAKGYSFEPAQIPEIEGTSP